MSLPILSNSFFEMHKPQLAVFEKWQSAAQWSSHFMPIYEWDDVLFVGCSQAPTQTVSANCKVVYVFCEAEVLNTLWEEYQSPTVLMNQNAVLKSPPSDEAILDPADRTVVFHKDEVKEQSKEDAPEGLAAVTAIPSAVPQSASFEDLGVHLSELSSDEPIAESSETAPAEEGGLEGLDLGNIPTTVSLNPNEPSPLTPDVPPRPAVLEKTAVSAPLEEVSEPGVDVAAAVNKSLAPKAPSAPAAVAAATVPAQDKEGTKTMTNFTSFTSTTATPEQMFQGAFKEMGKTFHKAMILMKQGEEMIPWKWDDKFEKSNPQHKKTAVPLASASPFRVVSRTQKSYHGYIVPNDVNDKFFQEWNGAQSPDHMTLSPILIDDILVGMVLGIGDKTSDTKTTLLQTEHLAEAMAKKLKATPQIFNAA